MSPSARPDLKRAPSWETSFTRGTVSGHGTATAAPSEPDPFASPAGDVDPFAMPDPFAPLPPSTPSAPPSVSIGGGVGRGMHGAPTQFQQMAAAPTNPQTAALDAMFQRAPVYGARYAMPTGMTMQQQRYAMQYVS